MERRLAWKGLRALKPWWLFLPPERVGTPRSDVRTAINAIENFMGVNVLRTSVPM